MLCMLCYNIAVNVRVNPLTLFLYTLEIMAKLLQIKGFYGIFDETFSLSHHLQHGFPTFFQGDPPSDIGHRWRATIYIPKEQFF